MERKRGILFYNVAIVLIESVLSVTTLFFKFRSYRDLWL